MIAEELARYLATQNIVFFMGSTFPAEFPEATIAEDLFLGFQPDSPDDCIVVYDETAPVAEESNALSVDQFGVQILVRNKTYTGARDLIMEIHRDLVGFGGQPFIEGGKLVHVVLVSTTPTSIGRDAKGRSEWSAHYIVRAESTGDSYRT